MAYLKMTTPGPKSRPSEVYRKTSWVRAGDAMGVFLTTRKAGDYVKKGDVLGTVTDPATEDTATIVAPRGGRIIGMAVPQLVLPGFGLFHLGFDPE
jgi:uncharacterized protein